MTPSLVPPLDACEALDVDEREAVTQRVRARLGRDWGGAGERLGLFEGLRHWPSGLDFALVPGGRLTLGLDEPGLRRLAEAPWWDEDWDWSLRIEAAPAMTTVEVELPAFLLERRGGGDAGSRAEARGRAEALGFRLPSEAELEWIATDGGREVLHLGASPENDHGGVAFRPSRFGLEGLLRAHWAADDWHPSHDGAHFDGRAREGGGAEGACRFTFALEAFVGDEDLLALVAALRYPGSPAMPAVGRFALSLG
ncbi:MAG: hypothetical protein R3B72_19200 [Polyangiaceae bacterium]